MNETNGWPTLPLSALATEMCLGKMLDKNKNRGTLQPYLRNVNVRWLSFDVRDLKEMRFEPGEESRFGLEPGDLVICEGGEPGRAAVWRGQTENAKIQKALHRVRFHPEQYDPQFAAYYLLYGTTTNRFARYYTGTTIKHLTGKALRQVEFPLPPIAEQRRIVAKIEELFSDLDAGVAALERAKANLKRYRAAVLKAAVEGKLTAAWRAENPCTESAADLLQRILHNRRQKWEQQQLAAYKAKGKEPPKNWRDRYVEPAQPATTNLPALPAGWCWCNGAQLFEWSSGNFLPKKLMRDGEIPVYGGNGINGYHDTAMVDGGTFVIGRVGVHCGNVHLVESAAWITDNAIFASCVPSMVNLRYVVTALLQADLKSEAQGGAQPFVNQVALNDVAIPLPPLDEQLQIVAGVAERLTVTEYATALIDVQLKRAARLRQSILKRAFEGKLVPQDPTDEPASVLLERIQRQRSGAMSQQNARTPSGKMRKSRAIQGGPHVPPKTSNERRVRK